MMHNIKIYIMTSIRLYTIAAAICCLTCHPAMAQTAGNRQETYQSMEQSNAMLEDFSRKCEKRTRKAEKRFKRYERKILKHANSSEGGEFISGEQTDSLNQEPKNGLGKEPSLDSLLLAYDFAEYAGLAPDRLLTGKVNENLSRAKQQLDITQRAKSELMKCKEHWKAKALESRQYNKWLNKMEKECYYYTAQINEYRRALRDPSYLYDKLLSSLRRDPRWADFIATLPAKPQNTGKMQPREIIQQMLQSQAASVSPDVAKLFKDVQKTGSDLLSSLSNQAASFGNMDNAAQMPGFVPNTYKTKNLWEHIDIGFNLQFDDRTMFLPSTGVAGAQVSFNFDQWFSAGVTASYRFGMGDIKNIRLSHSGAGYGAFANYKIWNAIGVQAGYERNWRTEIEINETHFPAAWTSSALAGLSWEYEAGKSMKGTMGVFYDFLHNKHTPTTNAVLWRMGWKF